MKNYLNYISLNWLILPLLVLNCVLLYQNYQLRNELGSSPAVQIEEGYKFTKLDANDLENNPHSLEFSGSDRNTVIFYFSPKCYYCIQIYPQWLEIVKRANPNKWRILFITRRINNNDIKAHLNSNGLGNVEVYSVSSADASKARLTFTPMTIVVDPNGEVEKVWTGLWKRNELNGVFKYFQ